MNKLLPVYFISEDIDDYRYGDSYGNRNGSGDGNGNGYGYGYGNGIAYSKWL